MQEDYLPNFVLVGAYFDGQGTCTGWRSIRCGTTMRSGRLNIEVETDQEQYRPGDTVQVQLAVTDQEGNPTGQRAAVRRRGG